MGVQLQDGKPFVFLGVCNRGAYRDRMLAAYDDDELAVLYAALHPLLDGLGHLFRGAFLLHWLVREYALPVDLGARLDVVKLHVGRGGYYLVRPLVGPLEPGAGLVVGNRYYNYLGFVLVRESMGRVCKLF